MTHDNFCLITRMIRGHKTIYHRSKNFTPSSLPPVGETWREFHGGRKSHESAELCGRSELRLRAFCVKPAGCSRAAHRTRPKGEGVDPVLFRLTAAASNPLSPAAGHAHRTQLHDHSPALLSHLHCSREKSRRATDHACRRLPRPRPPRRPLSPANLTTSSPLRRRRAAHRVA
jgi:hypothetical protein